MTGISMPARLLRGFAVDFLTAHSEAAARKILSPGYRLSISGHCFDGRENAYMPATVAQLQQFPGLCVTCHDVVISPGAVAMRFTEHGAQAKDGTISTWGGITMFRIVDDLLDHGWAEEDYFARKRQLKDKHADAIQPPHVAPWDQPVQEPAPETERVLRDRLSDPQAIFRDIEEISAQGPRLAELVEAQTIDVSFLFTAGKRAAFHAVVSGRYSGGYRDVNAEKIGQRISVPIAAIVDVDSGKISRMQLCGDRLGLNRSLF